MEPFIRDEKLMSAWEKLVSECEEAEEKADNEDTELDEAFELDTDRLVRFLKDYDAPTCIVFEITNCSFACGPQILPGTLLIWKNQKRMSSYIDWTALSKRDHR